MDSGNVESLWRRSLIISALSLIMLISLYFDSWHSLLRVWLESKDYGHGLFVVPITLYLVWLRRVELLNIKPIPSVLGVCFLIFVCALWFVANVIGVQVVEQVSVVLILFFILWALLGGTVAKILSFPILYLLFAVPVWSVFGGLLQDFTAIYVTKILLVIGVPAFLEGHYITIPEGRFLVDDNCGGLRYFVAALAIGALYAYLNYQSTIKRIVFVIIIASLAVVVNWARAFIVILMGHRTEMQHPFVDDHVGLGWVLFSIMIFVLFWVGGWVRDEPMSGSERVERVPVPTIRKNRFVRISTPIFLALFPVSILMVDVRTESLGSLKFDVPDGVSGWSITDANAGRSWSPLFSGSDMSELVGYQQNNSAYVMMYVAGYRSQEQGSELISGNNRIYDSDEWRKIAERDRVISYESGSHLLVRELQLKKGSDTRIIWYWYHVAGFVASSPFNAKALELANFFTPSPASMVVAIASDDQLGGEVAQRQLEEFVSEMGREIDVALQAPLQN